MTPYIVITVAAVGMLGAIPIVRYPERKDQDANKRRR